MLQLLPKLLDGGVYLKAFDLYQKNQSGKSRMFQNKNVLTFICRWCGVAVFKFFSHSHKHAHAKFEFMVENQKQKNTSYSNSNLSRLQLLRR